MPADAGLVARARSGDTEAFTQLIVQYQSPLYNLALRMVGNSDDAADITQEAFLRAWEKLNSLRGAPFKPWLFQIAVNLCRDMFRRRARQGVMPEDAREIDARVIGLSRQPADPHERAEANERARLIKEGIAALEPDLRAALVLRDVNGFSYDEIAVALRAPLGTVKSRIARARMQVQERLLAYPELFATSERSAARDA